MPSEEEPPISGKRLEADQDRFVNPAHKHLHSAEAIGLHLPPLRHNVQVNAQIGELEISACHCHQELVRMVG